MKNDTYVVIVNVAVAVGPNEYKMKATSKVFSVHDTMQDVMDWAETISGQLEVSDLIFSEHE